MRTELDPADPGRRKFIGDFSLASLSLLSLTLITGGCESWLDAIRHRPLRRLIRNTSEANQQIDIYRNAVAMMKALPASDCRNWTNQANIHNNFCPHGNWYFFPWHRAYLFHFEKICQKLTGESHFGLPYWNWALDGHLPTQFWTPPAANALFDATRLCTASSVADAGSVGLPLIDGFCNEPDFSLFAGGAASALRMRTSSGNIEATPHNYVHGSFVRGDMAAFTSPLDAIFWNHHCMVDLCWFEWNITRQHANTNDPAWTHFNFSGMFCDGDGAPAPDMSPIVTLLMPLLSYQYETGIAGTVLTPLKALRDKRAFQRLQDIVKKGADVKLRIRQRYALPHGVEVTVQRPSAETIPVDAKEFAAILGGDAKERVLLIIRQLVQPPSSDTFLRVFIEKPDADATTSRDDPHYAGSFYFFVHGAAHPAGHAPGPDAGDLIVDITPTLRKLMNADAVRDLKGISVSLVAVPVDAEKALPVTLVAAGLKLAISPVDVRLLEF